MTRTKKSVLALAVACLLPFASCSLRTGGGRQYEPSLKELDAAIDSFEVMVSARKQWLKTRAADMSQARDSAALKSICAEMMEGYEFLSIDSLSKYTSIYSSLARTADEKAVAAISLSRICQYKEDFISSEEVAMGIDTTGLSRPVRLDVIDLVESVNYSMYVRAFNADSRTYLNRPEQYYRETLRNIRTHYLSLDSTSTRAQLIRVSELRDDKHYEQALDLLLSSEACFVTATQKTAFYRYKSVLYDFLKMDDERLEALIRSEIYCLQTPSYDHLSLISVARMLSERGDLEHASKYISIAEQYSRRLKNMARMANAGKNSERILAKVNQVRRKNQQRLYIMIGVLSLVTAVLLLSLVVIVRIRRRMAETNARLKESDLIKDNYLFKYMALSVDYLQKGEEYHKSLRKLARTDNEALLARLRLPSDFETERKEFYKMYDRHFLLLFPDFLEGVNKLMKDDCKFVLNSNGTMPVELRVLSVIRLGMTDSQQISQFLNYSLSTVYTYRSRSADKSLYGREEFEKRLMEIQI